jgi:hypothetical protein
MLTDPAIVRTEEDGVIRDVYHRAIARIAARILLHIFGACEPPYDPDCLSCATARIIKALKDV